MHNDFPIFAWVKDRYFEAESFLFAFTYRYSVRRREYLWGADGNKFLFKLNNRRKKSGQVDGPTIIVERWRRRAGMPNVLYVGIATQSLRKRISKYKTGDTASICGTAQGRISDVSVAGDRSFSRREADALGTADTGRFYDQVLRPTSAARDTGTSEILPTLERRLSSRHEALLIQQLNPKSNTMLVQD